MRENKNAALSLNFKPAENLVLAADGQQCWQLEKEYKRWKVSFFTSLYFLILKNDVYLRYSMVELRHK